MMFRFEVGDYKQGGEMNNVKQAVKQLRAWADKKNHSPSMTNLRRDDAITVLDALEDARRRIADREKFGDEYVVLAEQRRRHLEAALPLLDEWRVWWQSGPAQILHEQQPALWVKGGEIQDTTINLLKWIEGEKK